MLEIQNPELAQAKRIKICILSAASGDSLRVLLGLGGELPEVPWPERRVENDVTRARGGAGGHRPSPVLHL